MTWFAVILLSIIEGLSEFLPISSTGHMIIAGTVLGVPQTEFLKSFEIIIQLGAILAVLSVYWKTLLARKDYWLPLLFAFIPTTIIGFIFYDVIRSVLLSSTRITFISLLLGGIIMIVIEKYVRLVQSLSIGSLGWKKAVMIGLYQSIAMIPGVSRSAATIYGGMLSGLTRKAAVEFSFLLALPIMAAATGLDLLKSGFSFTQVEWAQLAVGLVIAFVVARLTVSWLLRFVKHHSLASFGWYRIAVGLIGLTIL